MQYESSQLHQHIGPNVDEFHSTSVLGNPTNSSQFDLSRLLVI